MKSHILFTTHGFGMDIFQILAIERWNLCPFKLRNNFLFLFSYMIYNASMKIVMLNQATKHFFECHEAYEKAIFFIINKVTIFFPWKKKLSW
jgi:hypothetical protein